MIYNCSDNLQIANTAVHWNGMAFLYPTHPFQSAHMQALLYGQEPTMYSQLLAFYHWDYSIDIYIMYAVERHRCNP